jgi:hypothetical protein
MAEELAWFRELSARLSGESSAFGAALLPSTATRSCSRRAERTYQRPIDGAFAHHLRDLLHLW